MLGAKKGKVEKILFYAENKAAQVLIDIESGDYRAVRNNVNEVSKALKSLKELHNGITELVERLRDLE